MSDIDPTQLARERLAQSRAQQQIKAVHDQKAADNATRATQYRGYDAASGKPLIQAVGEGVGRGDRIITNGLIQPGDTVRMRGQSVDQMPRIITPEETEVIVPKLTYRSAAILFAREYQASSPIPCRCKTYWMPDPYTRKCRPNCSGGCNTLGECTANNGWFPNVPPPETLCGAIYTCYAVVVVKPSVLDPGGVIFYEDENPSLSFSPGLLPQSPSGRTMGRAELETFFINDGGSWIVSRCLYTDGATTTSVTPRNPQDSGLRYLAYLTYEWITSVAGFENAVSPPSGYTPPVKLVKFDCGQDQFVEDEDPETPYTVGDGYKDSIEIFLGGDRKTPLSLAKLNATERYRAWIAAPTKRLRLIDLQYGYPSEEAYCGFQSFKIKGSQVTSAKYSSPNPNGINKDSWLKYWSQSLEVAAINEIPISGIGRNDDGRRNLLFANVYSKNDEDYFGVSINDPLESPEWIETAQTKDPSFAVSIFKWSETESEYSSNSNDVVVKGFKLSLSKKSKQSSFTANGLDFESKVIYPLQFLAASVYAETTFTGWNWESGGGGE